MTIPVVPPQHPGQGPIFMPAIANPYQSVWWTSQSVTGVPESVMGWLVAQGFDVNGVSQDLTTTPPTNYYALSKQGLQPWQVLLSLCNSYTVAANQAREANQIRYNDIVTNWVSTIDSSQQQFESQTNVQNAQAGIYLADLNTYMSEIEALIQENRNQLIADAQASNVALGEMNLKLTDLETNALSNSVVIGGLLTDQSGFLNTFLNDFTSKLNELDQDYASHLASVLANISSLNVVLDSHVVAYDSQFATLATNYANHELALKGLLAASLTNTNGYVASINGLLSLLLSDYDSVSTSLNEITGSAGTLVTSHATGYSEILALLESDYLQHVNSATGFLTGLGITELARINEQFASTLSVQIQSLIDNGIHTSAVATDIRARNHRDRDEQIQIHNDRLNRERWENQHRLYEQQVALRARGLEGRDRLHGVRQEVLRYQAAQISGTYALLQEMRNRTMMGRQAILTAQDANNRLAIEVESGLYAKIQEVRLRTIEAADRIYQIRDVFAKWKNGEATQLYEQLQRIQIQDLTGIDRQYAAKQDVARNAASQRDSLLAQLQDALKSCLTGKERYSQILMQNASTLADHKHRAIVERMNTAVQRLEGWRMIAEQNRTLMAYQLDERNKLILGLYSFVQARDDVAPEWKDISATIAGLGDSAGGWITP